MYRKGAERFITIRNSFVGIIASCPTIHHVIEIVIPVFRELLLRLINEIIPLASFDLFGTPDNVYSIAVIYFITQLVNVPINPKQTGIDHPDVGTNTFHFLRIPQRIRIIITKCEEDRIWSTTF